MIETYFGLSRRPFLAVPNVNSYFPSETIDSARVNVLRCLHRGEGISLIIGQSGIGKTLLLRLLGLPFHLDYAVVNISNHRLKTPKAFLQQVLFELQQPYCGSDENELRLLLWDHLRRSSFPGVILLVDEGQTLSLSVLEEIRQMLNCDNGMFSRFRIAIAGTLELEERLTHPKLKAFNQWIVSRSYLEPLTRTETSEYVLWQTQNARKSDLNETQVCAQSFRLSESDSSREFRIDPPHRHSEQFPLFDDLARTKIYELTGGVPRFINQLCDHALVLACETNRAKTIDESLVRAAWASLQQIPELKPESKSFAAETTLPGDNVIEFGTLDDDLPVGSSCESKILDEEENTPPFFSVRDNEDEIDTNLITEEELELLFKGTVISQEATTQKPDEHVYQVKSFYKAAYPNGPEQVMNNWSGPGHQTENGVGTSYREFLYRDLMRQSHQRSHEGVLQSESQPAQTPASVALPPGMVVSEAKTNDSRQSLPGYVHPVVSNAPTPQFKPGSTVIRLHLGSESDRRPAEPNCLKSDRRKALHEPFEEEIPVPKMYHPETRPKGRSLVLVESAQPQTNVEALPGELEQLQHSLAQGIAFRSVKRVVSLLEETESGERCQTLQFDPDASRTSSGSALSKPKILAKPPVEEEFVTLGFQQESRKECCVKKQESRKMWIHSELKAKDRPPLKLRKPTEEPDESFSESAEEPDTSTQKRSVADFEAFFSKFYG